MKMILTLLAGLACLVIATAQAAESYPARPVRVIVPFPAGGPTDIVARIFAQKAAEALGQQMVVDNRGGAGGNIGMGIAANSAGDGYTVLFVSSSFMVNPGLYRKNPYDPYKSFRPVSVLVASPHLFFVHPTQSARTLGEMLEMVKKDPKYGNVATPPIGTVPFLAVHLLALDSKVKLVTIPYAGGGPSIAAVVGNQVPIGCQAIPPVTPHVQAGRVRGLALTSAKRIQAMPDVPVMAELGYKGHESDTVGAMLVPAGTPDAVVRRLHAEVVRVMALPDVRKRMAELGADIVANTPQEFSAYIRTEVDRWAKVVKAAGIVVD